ncbi:MAG: NusG-like protein [Acidobacteria bacterium]|nr:NusG-like protein [Acidobacteriota bacterium]
MNAACSELAWFAVHVRSNQEKLAALLLADKGIPTFLPLRREMRRRRGSTKELEIPLFPGYLFCQFPPENRGPVVTVNPVVRVVGVGRTPLPVEPGELDAVRTIVDSGESYEPWPYLTVGERVRVVSGPLFGLTGILTGERGVDRVVVSIGLIHRSVAAEVQRSWIAPARTHRTSTGARRGVMRSAAAFSS